MIDTAKEGKNSTCLFGAVGKCDEVLGCRHVSDDVEQASQVIIVGLARNNIKRVLINK